MAKIFSFTNVRSKNHLKIPVSAQMAGFDWWAVLNPRSSDRVRPID